MPYIRVDKKGERKLKIKRFSFALLLCLLIATSVPFLASIAIRQPEIVLRWFMRQAYYKRVIDFQDPGSQLSLAAQRKGASVERLTLATSDEDSKISRYIFEKIIPPTHPIFNYISIAAFVILSFLVVRRYIFQRR